MLAELIKTFFKIGIFTLGGGYAMIPLIEEEVVNRHRWVSKEELLDLIAIAQSCPGVFAINIAIFVGYKLQKVRGALASTLGTALPRSSSSWPLPYSSRPLRTTASLPPCSVVSVPPS